MLNGRTYTVVPMTLIVPGVLSGSKGPLYYPPEEVRKDHTSWNHTPIVVNHPTDDFGHPLSAREPGVLAKFGIGYVFKSRINNQGKLKAEGWFDNEHTQRVSQKVWNMLQKAKPFELSTGLFTDNELAHNGSNWQGKPYSYIARNYRPDHLAILPDKVGACSVRDGCGVLVNGDHKGENCPHCGASMERGDDGNCNRCGKPWPTENEHVHNASVVPTGDGRYRLVSHRGRTIGIYNSLFDASQEAWKVDAFVGNNLNTTTRSIVEAYEKSGKKFPWYEFPTRELTANAELVDNCECGGTCSQCLETNEEDEDEEEEATENELVTNDWSKWNSEHRAGAGTLAGVGRSTLKTGLAGAGALGALGAVGGYAAGRAVGGHQAGLAFGKWAGSRGAKLGGVTGGSLGAIKGVGEQDPDTHPAAISIPRGLKGAARGTVRGTVSGAVVGGIAGGALAGLVQAKTGIPIPKRMAIKGGAKLGAGLGAIGGGLRTFHHSLFNAPNNNEQTMNFGPWEETKHPRNRGKFASAAGGGGTDTQMMHKFGGDGGPTPQSQVAGSVKASVAGIQRKRATRKKAVVKGATLAGTASALGRGAAGAALGYGGSAAGSIGGARLGGAIGSLAGPYGTIAGSLVGSLVGGYTGTGVASSIAHKHLGTAGELGVAAGSVATVLHGPSRRGINKVAFGGSRFNKAAQSATDSANKAKYQQRYANAEKSGSNKYSGDRASGTRSRGTNYAPTGDPVQDLHNHVKSKGSGPDFHAKYKQLNPEQRAKFNRQHSTGVFNALRMLHNQIKRQNYGTIHK